MRRIKAKEIENKVCEAALKANFELRKDVLRSLGIARNKETVPIAGKMLDILIENAKIAKKEKLAICQDTGMVVVFCRIGSKAQIIGDINEAINNGIKTAYKRGFLRKSVVRDPLKRTNANTNTPCVIHYDIISGNKIKIAVMPKGFGSENSGAVKLFNPTATEAQIKEFIISKVKEAGSSACPPVVLGIGIGGTLDKAASLAKEALLRQIGSRNPKKHIALLEKEILYALNKTGIGPMGLGGKTTCLAVNILEYPTHIAGLPVCVNISCHALRSAEVII
ncbi:MAG: fumarate hydratase [Candidatus Omnitrophica bacterium]|nr:fumarate hydratase [Candidatus Omnitrophota bacterium]